MEPIVGLDSPKYKEAEEALPEELRPFYRQLVQEYEFLTVSHYGRGYVAYKVIADLVRAGWRPSGDPIPSPLDERKGASEQ
jgi:hypothetical protein